MACAKVKTQNWSWRTSGLLYQSNLKLNILLVDLQLSEAITPFHCPKELEVDLLKHQKEPLLHALQKKIAG